MFPISRRARVISGCDCILANYCPMTAHCCKLSTALIMKHFFCCFVSIALIVVQARCLVCIVALVYPYTVITMIYRSVSVLTHLICLSINTTLLYQFYYREPEGMESDVFLCKSNDDHSSTTDHP